MSVRILSASFCGVEGILVTVEVDISNGLPNFNIVGLGDTAIKESKERVRSAIINSGFEFPISRITVNLAPADIRKEGSLFDLPIAVGILLASGQIERKCQDKIIFIGELSLSGELVQVRGSLPIAIECRNQGINKLVVPWANGSICSSVKDLSIYGFNNLKEVALLVNGEKFNTVEFKEETEYTYDYDYDNDFMDVYGQESAKRAIEVAAAGNHNILLIGPPGSGKTMLAKRIPTILPPLNYDESLEVTKIYSVWNSSNVNNKIINLRPFRNPHHTATNATLTKKVEVIAPPNSNCLTARQSIYKARLLQCP